MKISFHGAAQDVTGSCHLLECAGKRILIDCGLFQGGRELTEENADDFGFEPESIDYLLLTHAHLDHCGRIPLLAKRGFKGEIITTSASVELARLVMLDSAGLQEADARYQKRKAKRFHSAHKHKHSNEIEPLYTTLDALNCLEFFRRRASYNESIQIAQGILYYIREGVDNRSIKQYANVFLDSPMAISATQIFERHPEQNYLHGIS